MPNRELVRRCLVAAVAVVLAALVPQVVPWRICDGPGCLLVSIVAVPLLVFGVALLAWVIMAVGRVRPAWPVALGGPLVFFALVSTVVDVPGIVVFFVVAAASYAFAALVTAEAPPRAWQVALAAPVVVLFVWSVARLLL
ncbi:hypothetical protein SAMN04489727_8849 [Amycolatopsis tolypomycina]|uniref:Uncharacterized protein n=1 Tax=Amycolatopsis tolypomycina TaxID=208445 RepID=A0A1H5CLD0_9PSEU|nr:hypothetical protein [Amycolatopsis tolypomycina]SED67476.1 hypothetical protein SAMN04489727_8849 [Amycolatopsis tolypomycina]